MKIVLINHKYGVPIDDPCCYPLGFMYVSSFFKSAGHHVKVLNYNIWDYDLEEELKGYDVAGFTGFEEFKPLILRDEKICREHGLETMLGGALATFSGIPEFCGLQLKGESPQIYDWNLPDYEGFGIDEYNRRHSIRYMGVLTTFGCPYSCTFCAQTCNFRMRKLDSVFAEIDRYVDEYKVETIVFNDNTLNINKARWMRICAEMKPRKLQWCAAIRCAPFDEEMAKAAKECGCIKTVVGVESFSQYKLNLMNKKIKKWQIIRTLNLLNKYKIPYHGNILVGFENETLSEILGELSLLPEEYNIFPVMVQPFIGTRNGKKRSISESEYSKLSSMFSEYISKSGMHCYPELPA